MNECPTPINLNFMGVAFLGIGARQKPLAILNFYRKANSIAAEFNRARKYALQGRKEKARVSIEKVEEDVQKNIKKERGVYSIIFVQMQTKVTELKNYLDHAS